MTQNATKWLQAGLVAIWLAVGAIYIGAPLAAEGEATCEDLGCAGCSDPEGVNCKSCATIGGAVCLEEPPPLPN